MCNGDVVIKIIFVMNFYQGFCELVVRRMATNKRY